MLSDPKDEDFDEDIPEEERNFYRTAFKGNAIQQQVSN